MAKHVQTRQTCNKQAKANIQGDDDKVGMNKTNRQQVGRQGNNGKIGFNKADLQQVGGNKCIM